jgi:hypothetical protein
MMGGHQQQCNACGFQRNAYNSCGDRHCPKCRTLSKERWLEARKAELLPTGYFHLVFTLPHDLNPIIHCNPGALLDCLFSSVNETLQAFFAADTRWRLVWQLGFIGVLHTWAQTVMGHCHLHVLPPRFVTIRYFVFLFQRDKHHNITLIRALMAAKAVMTASVVEDAQQIMLRLTGIDIQCCPHCGRG